MKMLIDYFSRVETICRDRFRAMEVVLGLEENYLEFHLPQSIVINSAHQIRL